MPQGRESRVDSSSSAPPPRVLMLSTDLGIGGGAEEQVMLLSLGLRARGWQVKVVSLVPPSPLWPELTAAGIPVASLNMRRGIPDPRAIFRLIRELRRFRPNVIHSHMAHANLLARAVRLLHFVPVINTMHATTLARVDGRSGKSLELAHRLTRPLASATTAICGAAARYYEASGTVQAAEMQVIHNGVDTSRYQCEALRRRRVRREMNLDGSFVWLAAGRLEPAKAYPVMFQALAKIVKNEAAGQARNILLVCGKGSLEAVLREQVRELGITDRVRWLGVRSDIPRVMNAADAFVLSSDSEGLPMVLLEASASSLPCIATSVGGNGEIVIHDETGFVVPPGKPSELAAVMERLALLPEADRQAMGAAARIHVRSQFDIERILDRWERLYSEFIGAGVRVPRQPSRPNWRGAI